MYIINTVYTVSLLENKHLRIYLLYTCLQNVPQSDDPVTSLPKCSLGRFYSITQVPLGGSTFEPLATFSANFTQPNMPRSGSYVFKLGTTQISQSVLETRRRLEPQASRAEAVGTVHLPDRVASLQWMSSVPHSSQDGG